MEREGLERMGSIKLSWNVVWSLSAWLLWELLHQYS